MGSHNYNSQTMARKITHSPSGMTPNSFHYIHSKDSMAQMSLFSRRRKTVYSGSTSHFQEVVLTPQVTLRETITNLEGMVLWGQWLLTWKTALVPECLSAPAGWVYPGDETGNRLSCTENFCGSEWVFSVFSTLSLPQSKFSTFPEAAFSHMTLYHNDLLLHIY